MRRGTTPTNERRRQPRSDLTFMLGVFALLSILVTLDALRHGAWLMAAVAGFFTVAFGTTGRDLWKGKAIR